MLGDLINYGGAVLCIFVGLRVGVSAFLVLRRALIDLSDLED